MVRRIPSIVALIPVLAGLGCTGAATGPEGALEQALARTRPTVTPSTTAQTKGATRTLARLEITLSTSSQSLVIARQIDQDGQGRFRVADARLYRAPAAADPNVMSEHNDGVESVYDGHAMAWRRGSGQWIERDVLDGLPARTLAAALDLPGFVLAASGDYFSYQPLGVGAGRANQVGGERVDWFSVTLDPAVRPRALGQADLTALRDHDASVGLWIAATFRPTRIEGELARSGQGAIVAGHLRIEGETAGPEGTAAFVIELTQQVDPLPSVVSFDLSDDRLPEARERPWHMIEDVLGAELLPPYRL